MRYTTLTDQTNLFPDATPHLKYGKDQIQSEMAVTNQNYIHKEILKSMILDTSAIIQFTVFNLCILQIQIDIKTQKTVALLMHVVFWVVMHVCFRWLPVFSRNISPQS
jgi:hypothetical protein